MIRGGWREAKLEADEVHSNTIIISSEAFEGRSAERVSKVLTENFGDYELTVIQYVRPHLSRLLSAYSQKVKTGQINLTLEEFVEHAMNKGLFMYAPRIKEWNNHFSDARFVVRPFVKKHLQDGDVVADFCVNGLGTEPDFLTKYSQASANKSPSLELLSLVSLYSTGIQGGGSGAPNEKLEQKLYSKLRNQFSEYYPAGKSGALGLCSEQLSQLQDFYSEDAVELDESFFGGEPVFLEALVDHKPITGEAPILSEIIDAREYSIHKAYSELITGLLKDVNW